MSVYKFTNCKETLHECGMVQHVCDVTTDCGYTHKCTLSYELSTLLQDQVESSVSLQLSHV
jgi:hypothetical protein